MSVVTAIRKDGDPRDPTRDALREAIRRVAEAQGKADRQREAIRRAKDLLGMAERRVSEAAEALESTRGQHAEDLAAAAQAGTAPKSPATLRAARAALGDAEDGAAAARDALEHLQVDGKDLERGHSQLDDAVATAVAEVIAPVAARILERFQRAQSEVVILQTIFQTLTEGEGEQVLLPNGQFARLEDRRMKPVKALRERFFNLDSNAGQERAREAAAAFRKWRTALCRDPEASAPELPS